MPIYTITDYTPSDRNNILYLLDHGATHIDTTLIDDRWHRKFVIELSEEDAVIIKLTLDSITISEVVWPDWKMMGSRHYED